MRQPKRLAHRQAEQTRARAQQRWLSEELEIDLEEIAVLSDVLVETGGVAGPPVLGDERISRT